MKGPDDRDPTALPARTRSKIMAQVKERNTNLNWASQPSLRIGVPQEYNTEETQPIIRRAWLNTLQKLKDQGHTIHTLSLPATRMALPAYYILAPAEASSNLAKYDGVRYGKQASSTRKASNVLYSTTRGEGLGEEVKRRILLGSYSLSAAAIDNYFIQAQKVRRLVQQDFNNVFALQHPLLDPVQAEARSPSSSSSSSKTAVQVDVVLAPTAQSLPPKVSALANLSPIDAYGTDVLTVPANLAGLPAINVPVPMPKSGNGKGGELKSVGMQVLAQYGDDDLVFHVAGIIESLGK